MQINESEVNDAFRFLRQRVGQLAQECAVLEAKLAGAEREMAEIRQMAQRVTDEAMLQQMAAEDQFQPQSQATDSAESG